MSFPVNINEPLTARWRSFADRYSTPGGSDFVLAWINLESGGDPSSKGSAAGGEKGIMQVSLDEATDMGMPSDDFNFLSVPETSSSYDPDKHYSISEQLIRFHDTQASNLLAKLGIQFSGTDYWSVVKLLHGLPSIANLGLPAFMKDNGGNPPASFGDFINWANTTGFAAPGFTHDRTMEILNHSANVGSFGQDSFGFTTLLILGGAAWFLYEYVWKRR